ncbi:MAG: hypothetical protein FWG09_01025 [Synergistaceae bacterium]|nr:hypothetical protein [Synergistaceae bacterium]
MEKVIRKISNQCRHNSGFVLIALYIAIGLFVIKDYGVHFDEPTERYTSLVQYKYVMGKVMDFSKSNDDVKNFIEEISELSDYPDRFYGTALHFPLVIIEHINDFKILPPQIYLMRHIYNFLNYALGACCFFLILRRRYPKGPAAFFGILMYFLYPRFFAESFYNNKDILFFSWYVISVFFALNYLEKPDSMIRMFLFAAAAAICTNTRILGISVITLVIVYLTVLHIKEKKPAIRIFSRCIFLSLSFIGGYILISPYTWESPVQAIIDTFFHFLHYAKWDYTQFYLGEMISANVPWHYIPVWMGATVPVLYQVLFTVGNVAAAAAIIKKNEEKQFDLMYDSFFMCLFFLSLLGFIGLRVRMYNGWRHAYFLFCPFLYLAARGLYQIYRVIMKYSLPLPLPLPKPDSVSKPSRPKSPYARKPDGKPSSSKFKIVSILFYSLFLGYMAALGLWIIQNHPYQYVYFNKLARPYAADNFELDYWAVAMKDVVHELLRRDKRAEITVDFFGPTAVLNILTAEEISRLSKPMPSVLPDYFVMVSVSAMNDMTSIELISLLQRYQKIYSITVDGYEICSLHRNKLLDTGVR